MVYPQSISLFGHNISVEVFNSPIPYSVGGEEMFIMGEYEPRTTTLKVVDVPEKPSIGQCNFIHEVIEGINYHADLKINHTQITTLASSLYQCFSGAGLSFGSMAELATKTVQ